ncbi:MAG: S9 family peptidase [Pseudomonadota bacterium]
MRSLFAAALAAVSLVPLAVVSSAQEPLPISEYGKLPEVERAILSPSGDRIAMLRTVNGQRVLTAIEDQSTVLAQIVVDEMKIRYIKWIGDERLLLVTSQTEKLGAHFTTDKYEFYVGRVLPLSSDGEAGVIFGNDPKLIDTIVGDFGIREIDGRYYGFFGAIELGKGTRSRLQYEWEHGRPFLYRVDLQNFETQRIAKAPREGVDRDWLVDANGNIAATLDVNETSGSWVLTSTGTGTIAKGSNSFGAVWLIGLTFDGKGVILGERTSDEVTWSEIPLAGGVRKPFLEGLDIDRVYFDDTTGHIMGYTEGGRSEKVTFENPAHAKTVRAVRKAFPNLEMRMVDWTSNLSDVIVRTSGNMDSGTYYAVDLASSRANALAYERTKIVPELVGKVSTFEYTASDGLQMDGILTLPPGKEAKNLPVVMLPHGGPHSQDNPGFDWWAQAFASRGYAVFQPNFRGSTNRTAEFRTAGYGEWGRKMQTDKSDGLAALAEAGIVDPERACIVGASYGGYAALAGVTLQQDIYRCAVAVAPVSDISDMYGEDYRASGRERTTKASLLNQLGPRDRWKEASPLRHAEKASAPIMLIHGKDDTVVPYSHSSKMADKLKDAGKSYEMVTLKGEDHWLSLSETRQEMLQQSVAFVQKHNPAD